MKNIKGIATTSDGNMKRIAITYDEIDETGKVIKSNVKLNRLVTDETVLGAITTLETYAQSIVDAE